MDKVRLLVMDEQCSLCGFDIEMSSYVVEETKTKCEVISHLRCYLESKEK